MFARAAGSFPHAAYADHRQAIQGPSLSRLPKNLREGPGPGKEGSRELFPGAGGLLSGPPWFSVGGMVARLRPRPSRSPGFANQDTL
jgi:hypothetical protein